MKCESVIKDISLFSHGRKDVELAESEMPGLVSLRREVPHTNPNKIGTLMSNKEPLKGVRISGSLHMTVQTAVLIETLKSLGATVRWCSCNVFSTQDHAAAAVVAAESAVVFAWKGETIDEYWDCMNKALKWSGCSGPQLIVDDGGDATLMVHTGYEIEEMMRRTNLVTVPKITDFAITSSNEESYCMHKYILQEISTDRNYWTKMVQGCYGVSEETTTGVHRLKKLAQEGKLLFPAINVNDCVTKSKFDNIYGCRHSLPDSIMRSTDILMSGKKCIVCGYGDVGKGCAEALKGCGARVFVTEIDPICALQACMNGYEVVTLESKTEDGDIFVTTTGNKDIIMLHHMRQMKNNAIVCNIGHFDNEIDMAGLKICKEATHINIKPQVDKYVFSDTNRGIIVLAEGRLVNLGCATGHPSFVMSCSFTNQTLAQLDLFDNMTSKRYTNDVYLLPKVLDEMVARLHLPSLNAHLTSLTNSQAQYLDIPVNGPYKCDSYRY